MNLDLEMAIPEPVPTAADPYALGWRYTRDPDATDWRVPLTEDDLVFPREDDFVVNNAAHNDDLQYLTSVFRERIKDRPELRLLTDHLIDFQHPALQKWLGPDLILFNGEVREWDRNEAVFPVVEMGARPLFVVEITSPTTRRKDLTEKANWFYTVGVPFYVLIDLPAGGAKRPMGIVAFQAGPTKYEQLPPEPDGRVWLEVVEVFLAAEGDRVTCYDRSGTMIPDYYDLTDQRDREIRAAAAANRVAAAAGARADAEKARADAADARADEAARKLAELEAELRRLRGNTDTPNS